MSTLKKMHDRERKWRGKHGEEKRRMYERERKTIGSTQEGDVHERNSLTARGNFFRLSERDVQEIYRKDGRKFITSCWMEMRERER